MKTNMKTDMKKVLTIAGSDCSGGAGIQADLKTFAAHGTYGMSVIVSVVAENTSRVIDLQNVSPGMIHKQMEAVFEDIPPDAVKIGMLSAPECMRAVAEALSEYNPPNVVLDPVMYAKNGAPLMDPAAVDTLIKEVLPLARVLTPNIPEAEEITGRRIETPADMALAAEALCGMGCQAAVVKGGHRTGAALDVLWEKSPVSDGHHMHSFESQRLPTKNTHGTGCTFSSAIAARLARGLPLVEAVRQAKEYVTAAIAHSLNIGRGHGPTHHFYAFERFFQEKETL